MNPHSTVKGLSETAIYLGRALGLHRAPHDINTTLAGIIKADPKLAAALMESEHDYRLEEILQIHSLLHWRDAGMPVFDLTHSLTSALLLTDPSDVDASEVKLPFDTFVIRLPQPFWELHGNQDTKYPVSYILIHTWWAPNRKVRDYRPTQKGEALIKRLVTRAVTRSADVTKLVQAWELLPPIPESGNLASWAELEIGDVSPNLPPAAPGVATKIEPSGEDKHIMIAIRRLLINLCLYITDKGMGEKQDTSSRPRSKKHLPTSSQTNPNVWIIGKEVKLDREIVESAKAWTLAQSGDRDAWRLRSRFTVRGHWRMQAHGKGFSEHKRIWIAPYWKGQGPSMSHLYTTKDPQP